YASNKALAAYEKEDDDSKKPRAFVYALLLSAIDSFDGVEIQGFNENQMKTWEPYIEPVSRWIEREKIYAITTSASDVKDKSLVMKALVAHILTASEFDDYMKFTN
ncbi:MAG: hypothetical protein WCH01_21065, partial [Methylococcaceae bacterium]